MPIVAPGFRLPVYILLWAVSAVLLGLTAARIDFTNKVAGFHEQVVVELLVASVLCVIWIPFSLLALIWNYPALLIEGLGILVFYTMFLAGASITTVIFPTGVSCGGDRQCGILEAIVAFAWTAWALTFILLALVGLERAPAWRSGAYGPGVAGKGGYYGRRAPAAV